MSLLTVPLFANTHGFRLFSLFFYFYMKEIWQKAEVGATLVSGNI